MPRPDLEKLPLEWNMDMSAAPQNGAVVIAMARYPQARAGFPRFVQFDCKNRRWHAVSGNAGTLGDVVICWAWMPREVLPYWPDEPKPAR